MGQAKPKYLHLAAATMLAVLLLLCWLCWHPFTRRAPEKNNDAATQQLKSPTPPKEETIVEKKQTDQPRQASGQFVRTEKRSEQSNNYRAAKADHRAWLGEREFYEDAVVVAQSVSAAGPDGIFRRTRIVRPKQHSKYPLVRLEETVAKAADANPSPPAPAKAQREEKVTQRLEMVADHIIVKLKPGAKEEALAALNAKYGAKIRRKLNVAGLYLVEIPADGVQALPRAVASYKQAAATVAYAEPDYIVHALDTETVPNDSSFTNLWGMKNIGQDGGTAGADIHAPAAWTVATGSQSVKVAVIDTGIDYTHPDLAANVDSAHGWNFVNDTSDAMDDCFHGTHCAGTIGASGNNSQGVAGVCWQVTIIPVKFLDSYGSGTNSDAVQSITYATNLHVNIMSNSWGGGAYSQSLKDAIDAANTAGILFVTAAGNDGSNNDSWPSYPASYNSANIISVAATDHNDSLASFSNFGTTSVHIGAPGVHIYSATPATQTFTMTHYGISANYDYLSGTSMATPHVAGAAALLWSSAPILTVSAVKQQLLTSADPVPALNGQCVSGGRLNVNRALRVQITPILLALISQPPEGSPCSRNVDIYGTADSLGGNGFSFTLELGEGSTPTVWTTNGVVLTNGGTQGVQSDKLASCAIPASQDGVWTLRLTVHAQAASMQVLRHVSVDTFMRSGFPVYSFETAGTYIGGANSVYTLVADLNGDGHKEILATGLANGPLYAWDSHGTLLPGWPVYGSGGVAYAAAKDVDGSGRASVAATFWGLPGGDWGLLDATGNFRQGWPLPNPNFGSTAPTMADVDGDGLPEVMVNMEDGRVHINKADGASLPQWPQPGRSGQRLHATAAGDLLGDDSTVLLAYDGYSSAGLFIQAWHKDGSPVSGWPKKVSPNSDVYGGLALGDVTGDGKLKVVVTYGGGCQVLLPDGTVAPGWPFAISGAGKVSPPALADLDGDGIPEIIFGMQSYSDNTSSLYVIKGDGTALPGWPQPAPAGYTWLEDFAPVAGDINGDGKIDVVMGYHNPSNPGNLNNSVLVAYSGDGNLVSGFPKYVEVGSGSVPAIADLDGIGRNQLILMSSAWTGHNGIYPKVFVWDYNPPGAQSGPIEWGQLRNDSGHTGLYVAPFSPVIGITTPVSPFTLVATTTQDFTVSATSPAGAPLAFAWKLDGTASGTSQPAYHYAPSQADVGMHALKVSVSDSIGRVTSYAWRIMVQSAAPSILSKSPASPVAMQINTNQEFSVTAASPVGSPLDYVWTVDSVTVGMDQFTYVYAPGPADAGTHSLKITVFDAAGRTATSSWRVNVGAPNTDNDSWPTMGNGPARASYAPIELSDANLSADWSTTLSTRPLPQVAVSHSVVSVVVDNGWYVPSTVMALDAASGAALWTTSLGKCDALSPPTCADGMTFVQTVDSDQAGKLLAFDIATGEQNWNAPWYCQWASYYAPAVSASYLYAGGGAYGGIGGFDEAGGTRIFFNNLTNSYQCQNWAPAVWNSQLFSWVQETISGLGGRFCEHDVSTGAILWSLSYPQQNFTYDMGTVPVIDNGYAYVIDGENGASHGGKLHAINLGSHAGAWDTEALYFGSPAVANGMVYAIRGTNVDAFSATTGQLLRTYIAGTSLQWQPIVTQNTLFAASTSNTYVFNLSDGNLRQTLPVGGRLSLAGTRLYIATDSGALQTYTFYLPGAPIIASTTPASPFTMYATTAHDFAVSATSPVGNPLTYTWEIDVTPLGTGQPAYHYAPSQADVGTHVLHVSVSDNEGRVTSYWWRITVQSPAPIILSSSPASPFGMVINTNQQFSVTATSPIGAVLNYVWTVDSTIVGMDQPAYLYSPGLADAGAHALQVTISDPAGRTTISNWLVNVVASNTANDSWPTMGNGPAHTSYVPLLLSNMSLTAGWSAKIGLSSQPIAQVAVGQGMAFMIPSVYFQSVSVSAINPTSGAIVWSLPLGKTASISPPTYAGGKVYVQQCDSTENGWLYALDAANGAIAWQTPWATQWQGYYAPAVSNVCVYIGGGNFGGIYGFNESTGSQMWFNSLTNMYQYDQWTPASWNGRLFSWISTSISPPYGRFCEHDPATGGILWSLSFPGTFATGHMNTEAVIDNGYSYVIDANSQYYSGGLHVIDLNTRAGVWTAAGPYRWSPAVANGIVYAIHGTNVDALAAGTGQILRSYTADSALLWQPIVTLDTLLISSTSKTYVFNLGDGNLRQTLPYGGRLSLAAGRLYIAADSGTVQTYTFAPLNHPPLITAVQAAPNPAVVEQPVAFSVSASDADNDLLAYNWTFGDGANGTGSAPSHAYAASGEYTAGVTVTDGKGGSVLASVSVVVNIPTYALTVNNGSGSGKYTAGTVVNVVAKTSPIGLFFDQWTGSIAIADVNIASTTIAMPAADTAITANYKITPPVAHTLTVNNGSGGGMYLAGVTVNIVADVPPAGQLFGRWTGDTSGVVDVNAASTTITMPAANTTITATYKIAPSVAYTLTVTGGSGGGTYLAAAIVTIVANAPSPDQVFDQWTGDTAGILDVNSASTTITMPAADTTITATYRLKFTPVIVWNNPPDITYGTALSGTQLNATASPAGGAFIYSPIAGTVLNAGNGQTLSVNYTPPDTSNYNNASANVMINVLKAAATMTLDGLSQTYNGAPRTISAATTPQNLNVEMTYNGMSTPPTDAGSYAVTATVHSQNYQGSASGTLNIGKAAQSIIFDLLPDKIFGSPPFTLSASASSNLAVSFSVISGPATVSGNAVVLTDIGAVVISCSQPGDENYNAALAVERSFESKPPFVSLPSASPRTAGIGQSIHFSAVATDAAGESSYFWSFDDGTDATGSSVMHAFGTPGTHIATVTVSGIVSADVSVRITAPIYSAGDVDAAGADSDGDGFSDMFEAAAGSSPLDASDTPFDNNAPAAAPLALPPVELSIKLNFVALSSDSLLLKGSLPLSAQDLPLTGDKVMVGVGGFMTTFVFNDKGKGVPLAGMPGGFVISAKPRNGSARFTLKVSKSALANFFTAAGMTKTAPPRTPVTLPLTLLIHNLGYQDVITLLFTQSKGRKGKTQPSN